MNAALGLLLIASAPLLEANIEERIGEVVPQDIMLRDQQGEPVRFADLGGHRPLVLVLAYYRCPMLCSMVLDGITRTIGELDAKPGRHFDVVTVSFDPSERPSDASKRRASLLPALQKAGLEAWPFLVGDEGAVERLLSSVGVTVAQDPKSGEWAHPVGFLVLTPEGRISRYFYGFDPRPFDLELAIAEAGRGKTGPSFAKLLLRCFAYDPATRRYGFAITNWFRAGGVVLFLAVVIPVGLLFRREKRRSVS